MKYALIFTQLASDDLTDVLGWYKSRGISELDKRFIASISKVLQRIEIKPELYPIVYKKFRRALLDTFPYKIIYFVDDLNKQVHIIAVVHQSREPKKWQKRI